MNMIQHTYSDAVQNIFHHDCKSEYLYMSVIDVLKFVKIIHIILKFILKDKNSILNNYSVLENIFVNQLHFNHEMNFNECLYFVYDD